MECNSVELCGKIVEITPLRYTPAGVAVLSFHLAHSSSQMHGGRKRNVECEIQALALDEVAKIAANLQVGTPVRLSGFLAVKSKDSMQLVLHVNRVELE
ncbi:MAG TPA: primosomal replication protein N [Burkholderiales bacterium]|nr:primosomal replication protein N [Burkholderiales bacterium]